MKSWVIGNWKLNPASIDEAKKLVNALMAEVDSFQNCHLMIAPSFVHLSTISFINQDTALKLASQDVTALTESTGAYTGDISVTQLQDVGVEWVLVGHSERRQYYHESNNELLKKVTYCLDNDIGVVFCIGESAADYDAGQTKQVLAEQLAVIDSLQSLEKINKPFKLIVAYEPVWAIGTGKVPSVTEVAQVHTFIREFLSDCHVDVTTMPIIYGGSVKPDNALEFAKCHHVSGVLVGGAALDAQSFLSIAKSFDVAIPSS